MHRFIGLTVSSVAMVMVAGCGGVVDSVQGGQQVLDSAGQAIEAADGLIRAGTELAAACATAQAAWVPGVAAQDARTAIDEAVRLVDDALALAPDFPGAQELDQVLASAQQGLDQDPSRTSLGVPRSTLETACALITVGG